MFGGFKDSSPSDNKRMFDNKSSSHEMDNLPIYGSKNNGGGNLNTDSFDF